MVWCWFNPAQHGALGMRIKIHGAEDKESPTYKLRIKVASLVRGESEAFECEWKEQTIVRRLANEFGIKVRVEEVPVGSMHMIVTVRKNLWDRLNPAQREARSDE